MYFYILFILFSHGSLITKDWKLSLSLRDCGLALGNSLLYQLTDLTGVGTLGLTLSFAVLADLFSWPCVSYVRSPSFPVSALVVIATSLLFLLSLLLSVHCHFTMNSNSSMSKSIILAAINGRTFIRRF